MTINHTTLGEIVKGHYYPMIEYRTNAMNMPIEEFRKLIEKPGEEDIIFAGLCGYEEMNGSGRLISHDGDTYHLSDEVEGYFIDSDSTLVVYLYTQWNR